MIALSTQALSLENQTSFAPAITQYHEQVTVKRPKTRFTDEEIISGLKTRDKRVINYVYERSNRQIKYLITTNSGSQMDAEDVFQDTMLVIYQKISTNNLNLTCSFETYLYSICKHLWLQKLNRRGTNYEYKEGNDHEEIEDENHMEEIILESEKYKLFQHHFQKMSKNDQKVLTLYMNKTSLKQIAVIMGYKSEKYAKHRKYICKEKLKNSIINDRQFQEVVNMTA
jgi:RNA polymerase sigma factor (sigma-70 family)